MAILTEAVLAQIDGLIQVHDDARRRSQYNDLSDLGEAATSEIITRLAAVIERLAPPNSPYRDNAKASLKNLGADHAANIPVLAGILRALRADFAAGHLHRVEQLVQADLFADFLEMAEHLLDQGYKDPAAVLAGGVLEEQLRKLCQRNSIAITVGVKPKKADAMNADLAAADVYNKLDQKSVTAWLDLRNKAAHGHYSEYNPEQVRMLVQAVRDFSSRHL